MFFLWLLCYYTLLRKALLLEWLQPVRTTSSASQQIGANGRAWTTLEAGAFPTHKRISIGIILIYIGLVHFQKTRQKHKTSDPNNMNIQTPDFFAWFIT
jgi:hypothetical protein